MRTLAKAVLAIAIVGGFLAGSSPAEAGFKLRLDASSTVGVDKVIADAFPAPAGDDTSGLEGVIATTAISVGNFAITITSGISKPSNAAPEMMHLNIVINKLAGSGADTLTVDLTDTGWTGGPGILVTSAGGVLGGSVSQVTYQTFTSSNNTEFDLSDQSSSVQTFTTSPFGGTNSVAVDGSPFSITQRVVITAGAGAGSASGDFTVATPLPAGVILALTGIPALGIGAWVRRRKTVA
jgi:hypothetical protein